MKSQNRSGFGLMTGYPQSDGHPENDETEMKKEKIIQRKTEESEKAYMQQK